MISILHPSRIVKVDLSLTGSKSITNRLLILRSIYPSLKIKNKSKSQDTLVLEKALKSYTNIKDVGHAGTAMRFLTAYNIERRRSYSKGFKKNARMIIL